MFDIKRFEYKKDKLAELKDYRFGINWPIVYIIEDGKEAYVGQTVHAFNRAKQHLKVSDRAKLKNIHIIADDEYNKSAIIDIESSLIKYMSGDGEYMLLNSNSGIKEHEYYDRERYQAKFETIWEELQDRDIAQKDLVQIENSDLFKYSPYKSLSDDQLSVVEDILDSMGSGKREMNLILGEPGTGKTIVATYLVKAIKSDEKLKHLNVGLVIPMTSLRKTIKRVFRNVKDLNSGMVLGPYDVVKKPYDVLIVDEAHRLQRRVNLSSYKAFDDVNRKLGLDKGKANQLDWIMKSSKHQVLFYDPAQSIRPVDIRPKAFEKYNPKKRRLVSQMRVAGGEDYIKYIKDILRVNDVKPKEFEDYDLKFFENIKDLVDTIQNRDKEHGLSRLLAGYAWEWRTKGDESIDYDIEIEDVKLRWNSVTKDWVNSPNALNEVGCIHTIQGYDLNYAGVIIGPEVSYDKAKEKIVVDQDKYLDFNGKRSITDPKELESYVKNIYKTLLTRGIKGTYVYVVDEGLREYVRGYF